jgi:hypothetical protein
MRLSALVLLVCVGCASGPAVTAVDDSPAGRLSSMTWLAGDWIGPTARGVWETHYSTPAGGLILGISKEHFEAGGVFFEFEIFAVEGDSVVVRPSPNGTQATVAFTLTELDREARRASFENPAHDFPTRLEYQRVDIDTLVIAVSGPGPEEGTRRGFTLVLKAPGSGVQFTISHSWPSAPVVLAARLSELTRSGGTPVRPAPAGGWTDLPS